MAEHLGREGVLKVSSTTVGQLRNYSLAHSSDVVEDSTMGDIYRTRKATMKTWSVNADLFWDEADAGQLLVTIGSTVSVALYPEGVASTDTYYSGVGIVTKFDVTAAFDGMIEGSISLEGDGALSVLTV
jgi:predicted secreted protein